MAKVILEVKNLRAKSENVEILKGVNLKIKEGEIQALLGPNASGKSTLAQTILGNQKYKIVGGKILFLGKEIQNFSSEKRVKLGLALTFQSPPPIRGLKLSQLLEKISKRKFQIEEAKNLFEREVNLDLSGGEKKISELIQVISLDPKLVIFDEIDSGLDIKKLEFVAKLIKKELLERGVSILLITHYGKILDYLKPTMTNVMLDGKIICKSKDFKKVIKTIKKYGFEKCKRCPFLAS